MRSGTRDMRVKRALSGIGRAAMADLHARLNMATHTVSGIVANTVRCDSENQRSLISAVIWSSMYLNFAKPAGCSVAI